MQTRRSGVAFVYAVPIGLLGGLIGLGGAEFRLPVLAGPLGYSVHQAVPLNLLISLVTLLCASASRATTLSLLPLTPFIPVILALTTGAIATAFLGATFARRFSAEQFSQVVFVLLLSIGVILIIEGFLPQDLSGFLPPGLPWRLSAGILFGLGIGLVSSLLGVAGGELIIPTLVFAFGADIKTAGTASLFISVPTVLVGTLRYASRGAFVERRSLLETVLPMSIGSLIGAATGGFLVGMISEGILKVGLGVILNVSALHMVQRRRLLQSRKLLVSEKPSSVSPAVPRSEILLATTTSAQDTELLTLVVPRFEQESGYRVTTVAVGTGRALELAAQCKVDLVLTHAPEAERAALAAGTVVNRRLVMHNTFLLAGPVTDPANVKGSITLSESFAKIAYARHLFVSRGDKSGTHLFELRLWKQAGITPHGPWYLTTDQGMGHTLEVAGAHHGYVLTDRATYLASQHRTGLTVLFEGGPEVFNPYHVMEVNPEKRPEENTRGGKALADFFVSASVQNLFAVFGVDRFGECLFSPAAGRTEEDVRQKFFR